MKIGQIKKIIEQQALPLFQKEGDRLSAIYKRNLEHCLGKCLGHDDNVEYSGSMGHAIDLFRLEINKENTLNNSVRVHRFPQEVILSLETIFNDVLANVKKNTYLPNDEKIDSSSHNNETLSERAKRISNGGRYGQSNQWSIQSPGHNLSSFTTEVNYNDYLGEQYGDSKESKNQGVFNVNVIENKDSQNTAYEHVQSNLTPLVMNAANAYHIGGGFEWNYGTQEESLFFTTNLHKFLYPLGSLKGDKRYHYTKPLRHEPDGKPNALYTKKVRCFALSKSKDDSFGHKYELVKPFSFDVFTVAAFDLRNTTSERRFSDQKRFTTNQGGFDKRLYEKEMQKKIELFFEAAIKQGNTSVVAVPLGCGAFTHPRYPNETYDAVVSAYAKAIKKFHHRFTKIDIVILNKEIASKMRAKLNEMHLSPASYSSNDNDYNGGSPIVSSLYHKWDCDDKSARSNVPGGPRLQTSTFNYQSEDDSDAPNPPNAPGGFTPPTSPSKSPSNYKWIIGGCLLAAGGGVSGYFLALAVLGSNPAGWAITLMTVGGVLFGGGIMFIVNIVKNRSISYGESLSAGNVNTYGTFPNQHNQHNIRSVSAGNESKQTGVKPNDYSPPPYNGGL